MFNANVPEYSAFAASKAYVVPSAEYLRLYVIAAFSVAHLMYTLSPTCPLSWSPAFQRPTTGVSTLGLIV